MAEDSFEHLVLDLDGTLIHSMLPDEITELTPGEEHPESVVFRIKRSKGEYIVFGRPYIKQFLRFCFDKFKTVSVWTAGTRQYALQIVDSLFETKPTLLWTRSDCACMQGYLIKPLDQMAIALGTKIENVKVLDDTVTTFCLNVGRGLHIRSWSYLQTEDKHLLTLMVAWELRKGGDHSRAFWIERSVSE